jgi:DNA-binding SARP family transcriptional activator
MAATLRDDPAMPPHPAPLTLHLHGSARAVAPDGRQLALRGRAAALVALVAQSAAEGGVGRERAAQWLWPDSPNPRQTLRQQLLRFRQALGQPLLEGEQTLELATGVQLAPPAPGALLLADEADSDERFGPWLAQQRQALRQQQLGPLQAALQAAEAAGDLDAALAHAQALLQLDASEERGHPGAAGDREDPEPPRTGSTAAAPGPGA